MFNLGFGKVKCLVQDLHMVMAGSRRKLNGYLFVKTDDIASGVCWGRLGGTAD